LLARRAGLERETTKKKGQVHQRVAALGVGCFCLLVLAGAHAQSLNDPMRPPEARPVGQSGAPTSSGLQAVLTSPERKLALIDGTVVPLGSKVRNATLYGVSDSLAVLKKDGGRDVLLMHPDIDKKPSRRERP
jgi:hypothetical protein